MLQKKKRIFRVYEKKDGLCHPFGVLRLPAERVAQLIQQAVERAGRHRNDAEDRDHDV